MRRGFVMNLSSKRYGPESLREKRAAPIRQIEL